MRKTGISLDPSKEKELINQVINLILEGDESSNFLAKNPKFKEKTRLEELGFRDASQYVGYKTTQLFMDAGLIETTNHEFMKA